MRIGFDISQTGSSKAGCGYFADSLIRELAEIDRQNDYVLYPTFGDAYWDPQWRQDLLPPAAPNFRLARGDDNRREACRFWSDLDGSCAARLGYPEIIHSNNFFCPPRRPFARWVYTLYDLSFLEHPEWTTEETRSVCLRGVFNASVYADLVVAISESTRRHFLRTFPSFPEHRAIVVPLASRFASSRPVERPAALAHLQPRQFWLCVGTIEPRKNHLRLLRALAGLHQQGIDIPLVLVGGTGWLMSQFPNLLADLRLQSQVLLAGYLDDESLQWLYQNCYAHVYPSLFEGFGLPVLEAMSQGAPVIASDATSLPEVVGTAGLLVDPLDESALAAALRRLWQDPPLRQRLSELALLQAARFSWSSSARAVLEGYELLRQSPSLPKPEPPAATLTPRPAPALAASLAGS